MQEATPRPASPSVQSGQAWTIRKHNVGVPPRQEKPVAPGMGRHMVGARFYLRRLISRKSYEQIGKRNFPQFCCIWEQADVGHWRTSPDPREMMSGGGDRHRGVWGRVLKLRL